MLKFLSAAAALSLLSGVACAAGETPPAPREEKPIDCKILKEGSKERADCESKQAADAKKEEKH